MPAIDFKDIGEILRHQFLQGTIATIDPATDTCTVDVNGSVVPAILFFHCTGSEELRENGAVVDAATEFVVGDQVFVVRGKNAQDEDIIRVISPLIKRKCISQELLAYLSIFQNQSIGRVDNFPADGIVAHNISFAGQDCDICWSYRNQSYVVVSSSWAKLVNISGTVTKTYTWDGSNNPHWVPFLFRYEWRWNTELFLIRTSLKSYIVLDHDLNLYMGSTYNNFELSCHWRGDPIERLEDSCDVGDDKFLAIVKMNESLHDTVSGFWGKPSGDTYIPDPGDWPRNEEGDLISYQDPSVNPEYFWISDYKFESITGAELRLYTRSTGLYEVLYELPLVEYEHVNEIEFDTADSISDEETEPPSWAYKAFHYGVGEFVRNILTAGDHQTVTFYDPKGGPNPGDYPSASALFILANSGRTGVIAPSIKVFNASGVLIMSITPPSSAAERISISWPQKYPVETTALNWYGWLDFASRHPGFALVTNTESTKIPSTPQLLADMEEINAFVNTNYTYIHDPAGSDYWEFVSTLGHGDCEDFALEKAKLLLAKGYPASALHLESGVSRGMPPATGGHGWLIVQTDEGDIGLDILYTNPVAYSVIQSAYTDRARQTGMFWNYPEQ